MDVYDFPLLEINIANLKNNKRLYYASVREKRKYLTIALYGGEFYSEDITASKIRNWIERNTDLSSTDREFVDDYAFLKYCKSCGVSYDVLDTYFQYRYDSKLLANLNKLLRGLKLENEEHGVLEVQGAKIAESINLRKYYFLDLLYRNVEVFGRPNVYIYSFPDLYHHTLCDMLVPEIEKDSDWSYLRLLRELCGVTEEEISDTKFSECLGSVIDGRRYNGLNTVCVNKVIAYLSTLPEYREMLENNVNIGQACKVLKNEEMDRIARRHLEGKATKIAFFSGNALYVQHIGDVPESIGPRFIEGDLRNPIEYTVLNTMK